MQSSAKNSIINSADMINKNMKIRLICTSLHFMMTINKITMLNRFYYARHIALEVNLYKQEMNMLDFLIKNCTRARIEESKNNLVRTHVSW